MRLFLALTPPISITKKLQNLQHQIQPWLPQLRWTPSSDLHLTLLFLGAIDKRLLPPLINTLQEISRQTSALTFKAKELQLIPSPQNPRVLALTVQELTSHYLPKLRQEIRQQLQKLKITPAPDKSSHLTLGRFPKLDLAEKNVLLNNFEKITETASTLPFPNWKHSTFHLFRSQLTPQKSVYILIKSFHLTLS